MTKQNIIYIFVDTQRLFIIAKLSIRKPGSSSSIISVIIIFVSDICFVFLFSHALCSVKAMNIQC